MLETACNFKMSTVLSNIGPPKSSNKPELVSFGWLARAPAKSAFCPRNRSCRWRPCGLLRRPETKHVPHPSGTVHPRALVRSRSVQAIPDMGPSYPMPLLEVFRDRRVLEAKAMVSAERIPVRFRKVHRSTARPAKADTPTAWFRRSPLWMRRAF